MTEFDLNKIPYLMQFQNAKGDTVAGDVDPEKMRTDFEQQGILVNGEVNWTRFEAMVTANRENTYTAAEDFYASSK
ncbi:MAG: hypothetical protein N4A53_03075 [Pelagimonas sp.]|jgi:hypothetical protein|nr:hypothetical protein [Pelagimonas sp.]